MKIQAGDIDIDMANRELLLNQISYTAASIQKSDGTWTKHNTGIYVVDIPVNPWIDAASIDYRQAEDRGYFKLDILNNSVYQLVRDRAHLKELVDTPPNWNLLDHSDFFQKIVHIGNHYTLYQKLVEPVTTLEHMAMFLALIRPAKRHLAGSSWNDIKETIWSKSQDGSYGFKHSHAMSYALLVAVHINLLSSPA